jgi:hypothetical protein
MGYTTEFTGEFRCRRVVAPEIEAFLDAIASDVRVIQVLADWLEERQDERTARARACRTHREIHNLFHALAPEHAAYLRMFSDTRRIVRDPEIAKRLPDPVREAVGLPIGDEAGYFVGGIGYRGQDEDVSNLDHNRPPRGQPGLWCQWVPNKDGSAVVWDEGEKFYDYVAWIKYLIEHFLRPWGYILDGDVSWEGEEAPDEGVIRIRDSIVEAIPSGEWGGA